MSCCMNLSKHVFSLHTAVCLRRSQVKNKKTEQKHRSTLEPAAAPMKSSTKKKTKLWEKLTFLQPFSFPIFFSFLSKQQAPMILCVWGAGQSGAEQSGAEWGCCPFKCGPQSDCSMSKKQQQTQPLWRWETPQLHWLTLGCEFWLGFTSLCLCVWVSEWVSPCVKQVLK